MSVAILGSGLVGTRLRLSISEPHDIYTSKNISEIRGKSYDTVYCAALRAEKWKINCDPSPDLQNIVDLQSNLIAASIKKFVLISTIDIYDKIDLCQTEEDENVTTESYGKHRFLMEQWVKATYKDYHILRLPGLFGIGLKKNIVFDVLNNNRVNLINPDSIFQWYFLDDLYNDISTIISRNIRIVNLFSEPIKTSYLFEHCFSYFVFSNEFDKFATVIYDFRTIHGSGGYWRDKSYIVRTMSEFIKTYSTIQKNLRHDCLVVSNIAWDIAKEQHALLVLQNYGIRNIEIALTKYFEWNDITRSSLLQLKNNFENRGFCIYSLQAVFYGLDYNVFTDKDKFVNHFKKIINYASILGAKRIVFGSPKNRFVPSNLNKHAANFLFIQCLKELAKFAETSKFSSKPVICLEPNASIYGCNYLNTVCDCVRIIEQVDSPYLGLNLDTGNLVAENDIVDLSYVKKYVQHAQISMPKLSELLSTKQYGDIYYDIFSLENTKISLEILNPTNFEKNIDKFLALYAAK